jgi:hypothetical protein
MNDSQGHKVAPALILCTKDFANIYPRMHDLVPRGGAAAFASAAAWLDGTQSAQMTMKQVIYSKKMEIVGFI